MPPALPIVSMIVLCILNHKRDARDWSKAHLLGCIAHVGRGKGTLVTMSVGIVNDILGRGRSKDFLVLEAGRQKRVRIPVKEV